MVNCFISVPIQYRSRIELLVLLLFSAELVAKELILTIRNHSFEEFYFFNNNNFNDRCRTMHRAATRISES